MDKNSRLDIYKWHFIALLMACCSQVAFGVEKTVTSLELSPIATLAQAALKNDKWHAVLPVLGDKNQYFAATKTGKVYQLSNSELSQPAMLDLTSALDNSDIIALTAITLDANFNYRERDGYHTFYTAHTEASKNNPQKLAPKNKEISLPYDAVVMRWQLNYSAHQPPKIMQQHEVVRIAIQQSHEHIKQLSFNPYIEPWHDDFGLLFIALAQSKALKEDALYAGSILRIKPIKFGVKSYTVPVNNPFVKATNIRDEIVFIADQQIEHLNWLKQSTDSLLLQMNYQDNKVLAQVKIGDDWRETPAKIQIKMRLSPTHIEGKALLYQGREFKNLWGKTLHLAKAENAWRIQASVLPSSLSNDTPSPMTTYNFIAQDIDDQAQLSLHQNHDGELILLEHSKQNLYSIKAPVTAINGMPIANDRISSSKNNWAIALIFFLALLLISYFYLRKNTTKVQQFLHQQWANFEVDIASQSLLLYKRHAPVAEQVIAITSLINSELLLNDEVISTISADSLQAFSNGLEEQVRSIFAKEHQLKMINEKHRKIQLSLTDTQNTRYLFCLYFRIGNTRHTKLKYQKVINKVIDWQWLFAQHINPDITTKRKTPLKVKAKKSTTNAETARIPAEPLRIKNLEEHSTKATQAKEDFDSPPLVPSSNSPESNEYAAHIDTNLVSALDKLVMMKKQGYLDENEFNIAKTKILKDLANE